MIVIGYHLAKSDILKGLRDVKCLLSVFVRLFLLPFAAVGIMYLCGVRGDLLVSMAISSSAPIAAITTMFSAKFDKDTELSVNMVSISTVLSLISMPLVVTVAQMIA
jgi:predicted permease